MGAAISHTWYSEELYSESWLVGILRTRTTDQPDLPGGWSHREASTILASLPTMQSLQ